MSKLDVNITLKELEECVAFAKDYGASEHKTITLHHNTSGGLGNSLSISSLPLAEKRDITNIDSL